MMEVPVVVYGQFVACESDSCTLNRECTNHTTAGDFRSAGGVRPELFALRVGNDDIGTVFCKTYSITSMNTDTYTFDDPSLVEFGECVVVEDIDPQVPLL